MSLRAEMKKYFIHEKADFIDDKEAVTDFDDLKDKDIDNDGDTDDSDEYLHRRFGTIAKMDEEEDITGMGVAIWMAGKDYPGYGTAKKVKQISDDRVEVTFRDGNTYTFVLEPGYNTWVEESVTEMNTSSATPGYDTPNAFGNADEDTIEADGWKKAPKTNRIFKPMEGTSTFKKLMANMYNIGNGQPSINEAQKNDIEFAVKDIRNYNRGNYDKTDWGTETGPLDQLAKDVIKNLGFKASGRNIDQVVNHLDASSDGNDRIPEDADVVRELYPILESVPQFKEGDMVRDTSIAGDGGTGKITRLMGSSAVVNGHMVKVKYLVMAESVSYREYKKDPTSTPKQKVNKGIAEVNKMLGEMEKIVNNNLRLKQEAGVDSSHFWKSTSTRFAKINERMTRISNRLKELSK